MAVNGQLHAQSTLSVGENLKIGGWVGPTADLDVLGKRKSFAPTENRILDCPVHSLVTLLTTLSRLLV